MAERQDPASTDPDGQPESARRPPGPAELRQLDALVGKWHTSGVMRAAPGEAPIRITGTDTYEWVAGGCFLAHWVDVWIGEERVQAIEIIGGSDASRRGCPMRSFDSQGNFLTMYASVDAHGVWTFSDDSARATLVISDDRSRMTGSWERTEDGESWLPWMDMEFTRAG